MKYIALPERRVIFHAHARAGETAKLFTVFFADVVGILLVERCPNRVREHLAMKFQATTHIVRRFAFLLISVKCRLLALFVSVEGCVDY